MLNLQALNWKLYAGGFYARAELCLDCWAEVEQFAYPECMQESNAFTDGRFVLSGEKFREPVDFTSKGPDLFGEGARCSFCNTELPGGCGEEVTFSLGLSMKGG